MDILAVASGFGRDTVQLAAEEGAALFQINLFWVIVSALNFILFFAIIWAFALKPVSRMLSERKERIEQGLKDAEQARRDRENAETERVAALTEARREANEIINRAQKVAQETRDADIAATREELERIRVRAASDIEAEKQRAIGELRAEVADLALAAASRVVGESHERRPPAPPRRGVPARGGRGRVEELMAARRDTAARRYAEAASEIALRDGTVDVWRSELDMAGAVVEDPAVARILANPAVALESRDAMVDSAIGSIVSVPVLNLVKLMLRRGRIEQLPQVAAEFRRLDNARQGIVPATATSASPLSQDEVRALVARLEQMTGARIELDLQVDPSLLGGLMVRVGDRMIDGSVRGRLERLRNQLVSGAL